MVEKIQIQIPTWICSESKRVFKILSYLLIILITIILIHK